MGAVFLPLGLMELGDALSHVASLRPSLCVCVALPQWTLDSRWHGSSIFLVWYSWPMPPKPYVSSLMSHMSVHSQAL